MPDEHTDDTEPTIDLSDELALVRAIQDVPLAPRPGDVPPMAVEVTEVHATIAEVVQFNRVTKGPPVEETDESEADGQEPSRGGRARGESSPRQTRRSRTRSPGWTP